jgi:hypothetical protein
MKKSAPMLDCGPVILIYGGKCHRYDLSRLGAFHPQLMPDHETVATQDKLPPSLVYAFAYSI